MVDGGKLGVNNAVDVVCNCWRRVDKAFLVNRRAITLFSANSAGVDEIFGGRVPAFYVQRITAFSLFAVRHKYS